MSPCVSRTHLNRTPLGSLLSMTVGLVVQFHFPCFSFSSGVSIMKSANFSTCPCLLNTEDFCVHLQFFREIQSHQILLSVLFEGNVPITLRRTTELSDELPLSSAPSLSEILPPSRFSVHPNKKSLRISKTAHQRCYVKWGFSSP